MRMLRVAVAVTGLVVLGSTLSVTAFAQHEALAGSSWRLELCDSSPLPPDVEITAIFATDQITGKSGVNRYFAGYSVTGKAVTFSDIGSTKMAGPEDLMALEDGYLAALKAVGEYRLVDEKLELWDGAGTRRLVFGPVQATAQLAGREWRLQSLDGRPLPADAQVTASFADGRVSGKAAVNQYFASYQAEGQALTFSQAGSTMMAGPEHLMALETAYLAALNATRSYHVGDGKLELLDATGTRRLVYARGEPSPEIIQPGAPLELAEGQLWVPLRSLAAWMGATVKWDTGTRRATAVLGDRLFVVNTVDNVANGAGRQWATQFRMLRPSGMVYVPLAALAASLGAQVVTQPDDHDLAITINGRHGVLSAP